MNGDRRRLERIVELGTKLQGVIESRGITQELLERDTEIQWLVTTPLLQIGEQANRLTDEVTDRFPDVPWWQVAGMRHRLVHDYWEADWGIVGNAIFNKVPELVARVKVILDEM